jgi:hypothetical protein
VTSQTVKTKHVLQEQHAVELALPAHMLFLILEEASRRGIEMREDLRHRLDVAAATPLQGLDDLSVSRVAKKTDDAANSLIRLLKTGDVREAMYQLAMFPVVLVDEGYFGLLLIEDAKDEKPDVNGYAPIWEIKEAALKKAARDILRNAQLLGYYTHAMQLIAPNP